MPIRLGNFSKERMFIVLGKTMLQYGWSVMIDDKAPVEKNCHHIQFEN